jgi:hypothetical protein
MEDQRQIVHHLVNLMLEENEQILMLKLEQKHFVW